MFTNNYIAFRHNMFMGLASPTIGDGSGTAMIYGKSFVSVTGATISTMYAHANLFYVDIGRSMFGVCRALLTAVATAYTNCYGIYFGSGATPATREDYTLASPIESGLSVTNGGFFFENDETGQYSISRDMVVSNTSEESVTISEIGCFGSVPTAASKWNQVLWERTVLSSPITIAPGESKLVKYKLTFNQPS